MISTALALLSAAAALTLLLPVAGAATSRRPLQLRGGDPLARLRAAQAKEAVSLRIERPVRGPRPSHRDGLIWLFLVSIPMLVVVTSAIGEWRPLRRVRVGGSSPEGGVQMRRRSNDANVDLNATDESVADRTASDDHRPDLPSLASRVAQYAGEPIREQRPTGPEDDHVPAFAELGDHVASVLEAAERAAERIKADAHSEARDVLERSRNQAEETLAEVQRNADEIESEAGKVRTEAEDAAEELRSRAEAYADEKRREADESAAQAIARAEQIEIDRDDAVEERRQLLEATAEQTEERLRRLVSGLRELAGRLDVLVGSQTSAEVTAPRPEAGALSLDDALRRQVVSNGPSDEIGSPNETRMP